MLFSGAKYVDDFFDALENGNFSGYTDYLKANAPAFANIMTDLLQSEFFSIETINSDDVYKYLFDPVYNYSKNAGKLHRPLTCIAAFLACQNLSKRPVPNDRISVVCVAAAIEHFQTAALIHDDIADGATLRRSKPCMHIEQGEGIAINAGDYGLAISLGSVIHNLERLGIDSVKILKIANEILRMQYMTIEGQAMDLGWARDNRFDISPSDYICMATKKSAYYSASIPCVLGAILADADDNTIAALNEFGIKIGLAFQIRDDLLNLIEASDAKNQKDFLSDITEGKRTLCVVKAIELADNTEGQRLCEILSNKCTDKATLQEAVDIMKNCGSLDFASNMADNLCDEAQNILQTALPDSKWKALLEDMANWAKNRKI